MFLRMVSMGVQAKDSDIFAKAYDENIISVLRRQPGCSFASLLQNIHDSKDCISVTIWESKEATIEYEQSGVFKALVESLRAFYEESNEFELKLTDDLSIEYTPVQNDPTLKQFDDTDTEKEYIQKFQITPYAAKIITLTVLPDTIQEFQEIFAEKVISKFQEQKGFIHIILLRKNNEFNIISFWDETIDLGNDTGSQSLTALTRNIFTLLPSSVQWQVSHKASRSSYVTTEEMKASVYRCLTGEWFSK
ncbi:MAG: antibiotic biosynthesis monooxygenase [Bacteriovoracaceae bacterium]|nr:antibiotic biosynthesis monooxygenase [Bacteroidota bacterium]